MKAKLYIDFKLKRDCLYTLNTKETIVVSLWTEAYSVQSLVLKRSYQF